MLSGSACRSVEWNVIHLLTSSFDLTFYRIFLIDLQAFRGIVISLDWDSSIWPHRLQLYTSQILLVFFFPFACYAILRCTHRVRHLVCAPTKSIVWCLSEQLCWFCLHKNAIAFLHGQCCWQIGSVKLPRLHVITHFSKLWYCCFCVCLCVFISTVTFAPIWITRWIKFARKILRFTSSSPLFRS